MARAYQNKRSFQRFKDAAVQDFLQSTRIICGADGRPFIVDAIESRAGIGCHQSILSISGDLAESVWHQRLFKVLKEEQWEEAMALNHPCLFDDARFAGILFGPLALLNESKDSHLQLKPTSALEPGKKRKRRRARGQSEAPDNSSETECESKLDVSHDTKRACLRSSGSIDVDVLADLQGQAEETAKVARQRLTAKVNSKTVDPRKREYKEIRSKGKASNRVHFQVGDESTLHSGKQYRQHWNNGDVGVFKKDVGGALQSRRKQKRNRRSYEG
eukprot:9604-Heterococcus_DN1.PRE.12